MLNVRRCNVCGTQPLDLMYESITERSLTSLCQIYPGSTRVYACRICGHSQSDEIANIDTYYDQDYDILVDSEEEDQIYEVREGKPVYRTTHQLEVMLSKVGIPTGAALLDFGCAKSSVVRALVALRPDVDPYLFDVSERYVSFWEKFAKPANCATYLPKAEWNERFDVVTSFFSLEHMARPSETLRRITSLLRPGGVFYCVVPNLLTNIADFVVVDHVNHFTRPSLVYLFGSAGLLVREIDESIHRGAFVVVAERPSQGEPMSNMPTVQEVDAILVELSRIADFWRQARDRLRSFESALDPIATVAIYGAGFYGAFIFSCLIHPSRISCFLDQNPFLQGTEFNGKPVLSPADLPTEVDTLLVGLNPSHAKQIIAAIPALADRDLRYFYL